MFPREYIKARLYEHRQQKERSECEKKNEKKNNEHIISLEYQKRGNDRFENIHVWKEREWKKKRRLVLGRVKNRLEAFSRHESVKQRILWASNGILSIVIVEILGRILIAQQCTYRHERLLLPPSPYIHSFNSFSLSLTRNSSSHTSTKRHS